MDKKFSGKFSLHSMQGAILTQNHLKNEFCNMSSFLTFKSVYAGSEIALIETDSF